MECEFCDHVLSTRSALNTHQKTAKYCLKLQGKNEIKGDFICGLCGKDFFNNNRYKSHIEKCVSIDFYIEEIKNLKISLDASTKEIIELKAIIKELREDKKDFQQYYKELSLTAVKRPITNTKNIQINNYIKNMPPLLEADIQSSVPMLTLEHHVMGAEGYAQYALEFPFKDKIVCVDVSRNKIKYKNEDGDIIEDMGFKKMMTKLCTALKDRSFILCQEHYEKLSDKCTEKEMDEYNFMETALAITKCANGRESDFCKDIIKMISRGATI